MLFQPGPPLRSLFFFKNLLFDIFRNDFQWEIRGRLKNKKVSINLHDSISCRITKRMLARSRLRETDNLWSLLLGIQQVVENEHFNDQFWFFAVPQFWLFLSLLYMYLRCFQVIVGKNTHGPRLAAILKFRKFHKGKRPKISKIDKFQRSFVAKGCIVEKKS